MSPRHARLDSIILANPTRRSGKAQVRFTVLDDGREIYRLNIPVETQPGDDRQAIAAKAWRLLRVQAPQLSADDIAI